MFRKKLAILLIAVMLLGNALGVAQAAGTLNLPAALQVIDEEAFYGNTSIDTVVVPEGTTTISARAFAQSSLKQIVLPSTLTHIADDAFEGCGDFAVSALEGSYAYDWCVEKGYISQYTDPSFFTYTVLTDTTCSLTGYAGTDTKVVIPDEIDGYTVTRLEDSCFRSTAVTSLTFPKGLTSYITAMPLFEMSALEEVIVPEENTAFSSIDGILYNKAGTVLWGCPRAKSGEVVIPEGVTSMFWYSFNACRFLTKVVLPQSLTTLGDDFWNCSALETVILPANLTSIQEKAFMNCDRLVAVVEQGSYAEAYCTENGIKYSYTEGGDIIHPSTPSEPDDDTPSEPSTPNEPSDDTPSEPSTPGEPSDDTPSEPSTPGEPSDDTPSEPSTPSEPVVTPSEPSTPSEPVVTPSEPSTPGEPVVTPSEPSTPSELNFIHNFEFVVRYDRNSDEQYLVGQIIKAVTDHDTENEQWYDVDELEITVTADDQSLIFTHVIENGIANIYVSGVREFTETIVTFTATLPEYGLTRSYRGWIEFVSQSTPSEPLILSSTMSEPEETGSAEGLEVPKVCNIENAYVIDVYNQPRWYVYELAFIENHGEENYENWELIGKLNAEPEDSIEVYGPIIDTYRGHYVAEIVGRKPGSGSIDYYLRYVEDGEVTYCTYAGSTKITADYAPVEMYMSTKSMPLYDDGTLAQNQTRVAWIYGAYEHGVRKDLSEFTVRVDSDNPDAVFTTELTSYGWINIYVSNISAGDNFNYWVTLGNSQGEMDVLFGFINVVNSGTVTPSEPSTPSEPVVTPSEPSTPSEPVVTPSEPSTPSEPVVTPSEPSTPSEPVVTPSEPSTPSEPVVTPSEPSTPSEPVVTPSEPSTPSEPVVTPSEPVATPSEPDISNVIWTEKSDGTIGITGYTGEPTEIVLPEEIDGKPVTSIDAEAFAFCSSLTSVVIPQNVKTIGVMAFYCCTNLKSVELPDGLTSIGFYAFCNCSSLTKITIPASVTNIDAMAFYVIMDSVVICGEDGSYAQEYAEQNGIRFEVLPDSGSSASVEP